MLLCLISIIPIPVEPHRSGHESGRINIRTNKIILLVLLVTLQQIWFHIPANHHPNNNSYVDILGLSLANSKTLLTIWKNGTYFVTSKELSTM